MPQSAFIVRPFGRKPFVHAPKAASQIRTLFEQQTQCSRKRHERPVVFRDDDDVSDNVMHVDFDAIEELLIVPALHALRLRGETTGAVIEAGNIRDDMFNRLITSDLVIADVSLHNPNVFYELGLRQAFRDKFTFLIRCDLNAYPFDLQTDRYFEYRLNDLIHEPARVVKRLAAAIRKTLNQYRADSPVFKLMPQLEAEDRSRFLSVPEDFREEVVRASRQRHAEMLDLLALECGDRPLWEIEGLRVVGRAQFEANFIEGAKRTWERILARYPDDAEANTVLSTVYQRLQDRTRSEQALARVSRSRTLSPARLSELRALNGRNLKAAWTSHWQGMTREHQRVEALSSPLLQRAIDAYLDAFKIDLNNSYAGLNALTLMVIQAELIDGHREAWRKLLRDKTDEQREFEQRTARIDQFAQALQLSVESERDRLAGRGQGDPWFAMLEAAVMCTVSRQPTYVAQLYVEARYYGPPKSEASMVSALKMYRDLGIQGAFEGRRPEHLGTIGDNVAAALAALGVQDLEEGNKPAPAQLLVFVGLRVDEGRRANAQSTVPRHALDEPPVGEGGVVFPAEMEDETRRLIVEQIEEARKNGGNLLGMAGGASGGDILFHEVCRDFAIPTRMFLALTKPQYVGEYVAPAGGDWVRRFNALYRQLSSPPQTDAKEQQTSNVKVFADSLDLPRWLQDQELYNVGRRSMLWMLQHAHALSRNLGTAVEPTLIALHSKQATGAPEAFGGVRHAIRLAQMHGVNVRQIAVPIKKAKTENGQADRAAHAETALKRHSTSQGGKTEPPPGPVKAKPPSARPMPAATVAKLSRRSATNGRGKRARTQMASK
jgi:tetratricopeptide (TPR) repeat protein